jgi:hypothetical protein
MRTRAVQSVPLKKLVEVAREAEAMLLAVAAAIVFCPSIMDKVNNGIWGSCHC